MTLIADLIADIDDFGFTDTDTSTKVSAIQGAIEAIEQSNPWPFLEQSIDLTFDGTSGIPTNWPSNFHATLRLKDIGVGRRLDWLRLDDFEDFVGTDYVRVERPWLYYFEAGQAKVWPIPPAGTVVRMKYLAYTGTITQDSLNSAVLIPVKYKKVILYHALVDLNDLDDDPDIAGRNEMKADRALQRMIADAFQRQFDRPDIIHATDPDDWDFGSPF